MTMPPLYDSFEQTEIDVLHEKCDLHVFAPWLIPIDQLPDTTSTFQRWDRIEGIPLPYANQICAEPKPDYRMKNVLVGAQVLRKHNLDWLYALFGHDPGMMAAIYSHEVGVPFVVSFFGFDFQVDVGNMKHRVPWLLKHAAVVRCESETAKARLVEFLPEAESKIVIVPAAFNPYRYTAITDRKVTDTVNLVSVNRLIDVKGMLPACNAIMNCMDKNTNLVWSIWGDGPDSEKLTQMKNDYPIHLRGVLTHKRDLHELDGEHIFIAPYVITQRGDKDNLPLAVQEAFAMGFPVVMGHGMGFPDEIREFTRIAAPDTPDFENAILELAANESLRREMGTKARRFAEDYLDFGKNVDKILERMNEYDTKAETATG